MHKLRLVRRVRLKPCMALFGLLAVLSSGAAAASELGDEGGIRAQVDTRSLGAGQGDRYIVELSDPPLAGYTGALPGFAATAPASAAADALDDAGRLNVQSVPARAYASYLASRQNEMLQTIRRLAPGAEASYRYQVALNGMTLRLDARQAEAVRELPGVRSVTREQAVIPLMDASLPRIAAPEAWGDARIGGRAEAGRGQRIAIIDSGITAEHPFFDDAGFTAPEGFPRASLRLGEQVLDYDAEDLAKYTNNKVIVARSYVNPELLDPEATEDPRSTWTPLADGLAGFHGAHVAGIAAGSIRTGAPGSSAGSLDLSGVAPGAWLMAYKFSNAYTPEILAMIDDAVADGADVINNSWGTSAMNLAPGSAHPVARAFEAAAQAGVVVVAAAGNAGSNGEATLGGPHQMSPDVITVANSQTGRSFAWKLHASDDGLPEPLTEHDTAYEAFENDFDVIEKPAARIADFCNVLGLVFGAAGKVVLEPLSGSCPIPGFDLPVDLPDELGWVTKLLIAGIANAATPQPVVESIVFYGPDGDPETLVTLLGFLDQFTPFFEQAGLAVKFPVVAIITGDEAMALADWADTHVGTLMLELDSTPQSLYDPSLDDAANLTSSQGPVPQALLSQRATGFLKPDLAAPGTNVVSTNTGTAGEPDGFVAASGTSMSSPMVAGAAAVIRQLHPDWSPADVKSALMLTSDPSVTVDGSPAPATVQGSGRLNLARAIDPGLLLQPPNVDLRLPAGEAFSLKLTLRDVRTLAGGVTYVLREEPGVGAVDGQTVFDLGLAPRVSLAAGGQTELSLSTKTAGLPAGVYDGWIVFEEAESAAHQVRLRYRLELAGDRKDVLLLDVRRRSTNAGGGGIPGIPGLPGAGFEDGPDHSRYWISALEQADLSHDIWTVAEGAEAGGPPLSVLQRYDLVILAAGDGNAPLDQMARGMTSLQMYLLGGGRLLVSGHDWTHAPETAQLLGLQNNGAMYFLSRYFAGFERIEDDVALDEASGVIAPVRLFDRPIALARSESQVAAGNGGRVDIGRPLAGLQTLAPAGGAGGGLAPDLGIAAPMVVDRIMPYMLSYLEIDGRGSLMTGVTGDASLEAPERADFIPWRALFASFAIESVTEEADSLGRADLLEAVHAWAVEPSDLSLGITGPREVETGQRATFIAEIGKPDGMEIIGWRWDRGDGRGFVSSTEPLLNVTWMTPGRHALRVEASTALGHTDVGTLEVEVTGQARIFLPAGLVRQALR